MNHVPKLRQIIKASGLTQQKLAEQLDVSFASLNAWINGRANPRKSALGRIDELFAEYVGGISLEAEDFDELITQAESQTISLTSLLNDQKTVDKLSLVLTYHTDAIEGSTMTLADTSEVIFRNTALSSRTLVEQLEARNHHAALLWLLQQLASPRFTIDENLILMLHAKLMNGIQSDAGTYRRQSVRISGTRVVVANPVQVPKLITKLLSKKHIGSITAVLAHHHAEFEQIHPFSDGNGRVGRLLMLALAFQAGVIPPIILRERRAVYYRSLEDAQVKSDFQALQQFIAESILYASQEIFPRKRHVR